MHRKTYCFTVPAVVKKKNFLYRDMGIFLLQRQPTRRCDVYITHNDVDSVVFEVVLSTSTEADSQKCPFGQPKTRVKPFLNCPSTEIMGVKIYFFTLSVGAVRFAMIMRFFKTPQGYKIIHHPDYNRKSMAVGEKKVFTVSF